MKENESIWHYLSPGLGEFTIPKRAFWYEEIPCFTAFKAVWLGKKRKPLLGSTEYLVLYRNFEKCVTDWIPITQLIDRNPYVERSKVCRDKELNKLFDNILNEATNGRQ
jgi:hypothetical protein